MPTSACARPTQLVRANALELLDNVLEPELRQLLVPLLDAQVTIAERIEIANRLVGAPLDTAEQAVATLLGERGPLAAIVRCLRRRRAAAARPRRRPERFENDEDPVLKQSVEAARRRLAGEKEAPVQAEPAPAEIGLGRRRRVRRDSRLVRPRIRLRSLSLTGPAAAPACARSRGSAARGAARAPATRLPVRSSRYRSRSA